MNQKEIIKRVIEHGKPERIGWNFNSPHENDFSSVGAAIRSTPWGYHPEILEEVPWFKGQVMKDPFGNIWGRLENISKGEVIKGALQEGWEGLDRYSLPAVEKEWLDTMKERVEANKDKYVVGHLPGFPFSIMRTIRGMENFLVDILLETEKVQELGDRVMSMLEEIIDLYRQAGADGIMFAEDWGTQQALLISPQSWRQVFRPWFERIARKVHQENMHFIMHSCGYIYEIVGDLVEAGVDVLQLDQPGLMGVEKLSGEFGDRAAFYCPVDIQKIMLTGDKAIIQQEARKMIRCFGKNGGGFIAKDYPQWEAIDVKEEWAQWARDIFIKEGYYR